MDIIICENCNFENEYGNKLCVNCGHKLYYIDENENLENFEYDIEEVSEKEDGSFWNIMLTTTNSIEGYNIESYIDVITEESVTGIGIGTQIKSLGDILANLVGEEQKALTSKIQETKNRLKKKIKQKAKKLGGDAVVGLDFESSSFAGGVIMVSASGTVVKIKKIETENTKI